MSFCVCIDAGHGSQTIGAVSPHNGLKEYVVAWEIAWRVSAKLLGYGYKVVNTKCQEWDTPSLTQRVKVANDAKCDAFVTIHLNAAAEYNPTPSGCETWIYDKAKEPTERLAAHVQAELVSILKCKDRGVRRSAEFTTLKKTKMPAICVEPAFMTNAAESKQMKYEKWICRVANAIAAGINKWAKEMESAKEQRR